MKTFIQSNIFTLSLCLFVFLSSILIACTNKPTAQQQPKQHTIESFTINNVSYNTKLHTTVYYGSSNTSNGGIYFTDNEIDAHSIINTNDIVEAVFDSEGDLISVNKVK